MGSRGIRRRKAVHHLPKVSDEESQIENGPPHIMWPDPHSGFEPSVFGPAGGARNLWAFINTLQRGRRRSQNRPPVSVVVTLIAVWVAAVSVVALLVHLHH